MTRFESWALLGILVWAAASCPGFVKCDYHNVQAAYAGDEYPNGIHYRVYAHGYGADKHEIRVKCD
jgi:hypothetical protein